MLFQYSKNLEGTKTTNKDIDKINEFQYSKNLEGTKTNIVVPYENVFVSV